MTAEHDAYHRALGYKPAPRQESDVVQDAGSRRPHLKRTAPGAGSGEITAQGLPVDSPEEYRRGW